MVNTSLLQEKNSDYKSVRQENYKKDSKDRLCNIMKTKVKTTMVGAVASIEEKFANLIENDPEFREMFQEVRSEIFDKGNTQMRNVEAELSQYDVTWNRYEMKLPVKTRTKVNQDEN